MKKASSIVLLVLAVAFAGTAAAPPKVTPTPVPGAIQSPGQAMIDQEEAALSGRGYTYDPAGRRDPLPKTGNSSLLSASGRRIARSGPGLPESPACRSTRS